MKNKPTIQRIMYVCSGCVDEAPEACGQSDVTDLIVMPDGRWLCEGCYELEKPESEFSLVPFRIGKRPPLYVPMSHRYKIK